MRYFSVSELTKCELKSTLWPVPGLRFTGTDEGHLSYTERVNELVTLAGGRWQTWKSQVMVVKWVTFTKSPVTKCMGLSGLTKAICAVQDEGEKREQLLALQYSRGENLHAAVTVGLTKDDFCFGEHCHPYGQTPLTSCLQTKCVFITASGLSLPFFLLVRTKGPCTVQINHVLQLWTEQYFSIYFYLSFLEVPFLQHGNFYAFHVSFTMLSFLSTAYWLEIIHKIQKFKTEKNYS